MAAGGDLGWFVCVMVGCKVRCEGGLLRIHVGLRMNDIKNNHKNRQWLCRRRPRADDWGPGSWPTG